MQSKIWDQRNCGLDGNKYMEDIVMMLYKNILVLAIVMIVYVRTIGDNWNIPKLNVYEIFKLAVQLFKQVVVYCTILVIGITTVGYFSAIKESEHQFSLEVLFGLVVILGVHWFVADILIVTIKIIDKIRELKRKHKSDVEGINVRLSGTLESGKEISITAVCDKEGNIFYLYTCRD